MTFLRFIAAHALFGQAERLANRFSKSQRELRPDVLLTICREMATAEPLAALSSRSRRKGLISETVQN